MNAALHTLARYFTVSSRCFCYIVALSALRDSAMLVAPPAHLDWTQGPCSPASVCLSVHVNHWEGEMKSGNAPSCPPERQLYSCLSAAHVFFVNSLSLIAHMPGHFCDKKMFGGVTSMQI